MLARALKDSEDRKVTFVASLDAGSDKISPAALAVGIGVDIVAEERSATK